jgi:hypothetical protein
MRKLRNNVCEETYPAINTISVTFAPTNHIHVLEHKVQKKTTQHEQNSNVLESYGFVTGGGGGAILVVSLDVDVVELIVVVVVVVVV